jgi:hypothetical protein
VTASTEPTEHHPKTERAHAHRCNVQSITRSAQDTVIVALRCDGGCPILIEIAEPADVAALVLILGSVAYDIWRDELQSEMDSLEQEQFQKEKLGAD